MFGFNIYKIPEFYLLGGTFAYLIIIITLIVVFKIAVFKAEQEEKEEYKNNNKRGKNEK